MKPVLELTELSMPWIGLDPFIMTVHRVDHYPAGKRGVAGAVGRPGRAASQRRLLVPRRGGACTTGSGSPVSPSIPIVVSRRSPSRRGCGPFRFARGHRSLRRGRHAMAHHRFRDPAFRDVPLGICGWRQRARALPVWLNLPPQSKMVPAHFSMLWGEEIPTVVAEGGLVTVDVIAGALDGHRAPPPPPDSWASRPGSDLAILLIEWRQVQHGSSLPPLPASTGCSIVTSDPR